LELYSTTFGTKYVVFIFGRALTKWEMTHGLMPDKALQPVFVRKPLTMTFTGVYIGLFASLGIGEFTNMEDQDSVAGFALMNANLFVKVLFPLLSRIPSPQCFHVPCGQAAVERL
jgi:hypothetical protein